MSGPAIFVLVCWAAPALFLAVLFAKHQFAGPRDRALVAAIVLLWPVAVVYGTIAIMGDDWRRRS